MVQSPLGHGAIAGLRSDAVLTQGDGMNIPELDPAQRLLAQRYH